MTTELIIQNLGRLVPGKLSYSETSNVFLTNGYVSAASNVYFNAVRFAEGIIIKEDVGEGYAHTFLNGLRIYSLKEKVLLTDRTYHCCFYNKEKVMQEAKEMLLQLLSEAAQNSGLRLNKKEAEVAIDRILLAAFNGDQLSIAQRQVNRFLSS